MALLPDVLLAPPVELRRSTLAHLDALLVALEAARPELQQWMPWATPWPSAELERAVVAAGEAQFDADASYPYFVFAGDELVGSAELLQNEFGWGVGYWIRSDRTGQGYATAAARALTSAAFELLGVDAVYVTMDQANLASAAVPRKLGFTLASEQVRPIQAPGHTGRGYVWSTTRAQWTG